MLNGLVIKSISDFYYVLSDDKIYQCKVRGKLKNYGLPLVGDNVEFSCSAGDKGIIESIIGRKNSFVRPPVANIDCLVFIASEALPRTEPYLIDQFSVYAAELECDFILCINKSDIDNSSRLYDLYSAIGFTVIRTSTVTGEGTEELLELIDGKISVFTGNSGVGKSSLLNVLLPDANIKTDVISQKLSRGKHTTRHVEFYSPNKHTYIADTPGFAAFELESFLPIDKYILQYDFPEFADCIGNCRYSDCVHIAEPDCAVTSKLNSGLIPKERYASYLRLYDKMSEINRYK